MSARIERAFAEQGGPVGPVILGLAALWGLVTIVILFGILGAVHGTKTNATKITGSLTGIEHSTQKASLATTLNKTAKKIRIASDPLAPRLAQTSQSAAQLDAITAGLLANVKVIESASGTTLSSVEASARTADEISATSAQIARLAAETDRAVTATAGKARSAYSSIYFTQSLSNSVKNQILSIVKDIAGIAAHAKRNEARGAPGP
jgi:methyl-accepting chemotaxis protein